MHTLLLLNSETFVLIYFSIDILSNSNLILTLVVGISIGSAHEEAIIDTITTTQCKYSMSTICSSGWNCLYRFIIQCNTLDRLLVSVKCYVLLLCTQLSNWHFYKSFFSQKYYAVLFLCNARMSFLCIFTAYS